MVKREATRKLKLTGEEEWISSCVIKEFEFEERSSTYLKEIHFSNHYTARVIGKVCYQDKPSVKPTWINLFHVQLMPHSHYCEGACADVKISLPHDFETTSKTHRLRKVSFILKQPSPIWKEFSVHAVKFYSEYITQPGSTYIRLEAGPPSRSDLTKLDQYGEDLVQTLQELCNLVKVQRETSRSGDLTAKCEANELTEASFSLQ
ncbi:nicolin-1 [Paragonimus westermani]|uniref:Nicolin-1 n=1 Tax=Paragonimus westermani TaxID=34504 RepID=A0A5J4NGE9_9TREM|nr:nicolin-1 [Paragonimus westermani]